MIVFKIYLCVLIHDLPVDFISMETVGTAGRDAEEEEWKGVGAVTVDIQ